MSETTKTNEEKGRPRYNMFQNIGWMFRRAVRTSRWLLPMAGGEINQLGQQNDQGVPDALRRSAVAAADVVRPVGGCCKRRLLHVQIVGGAKMSFVPKIA